MADFRLLTSVIHGSGALLLDMSHMSLLEASMRRLPMSTPLPHLEGMLVLVLSFKSRFLFFCFFYYKYFITEIKENEKMKPFGFCEMAE